MDVEDLLIQDEGCKDSIYLDSVGIQTIGIGHNIEANPLPPGFVPPLKRIQIDQLFQSDLTRTKNYLVNGLSWFGDLDEVRQAVLIGMCYNMGWGALSKFTNTLELIRTESWTAASVAMLDSLWARQLPSRSEKYANMMLSGLWPDNKDFPNN